ncbi:MAG: NAD-dependent epimerase/dehydratase family protein [Chloroflexota bacterium]
MVVGGTGLVGSAIVRELTRRGIKVAVLSRDPLRVAKKFPG